MDVKYEAFMNAVQTGSFKSAADLLGYTQAGISYMISSLEKDMGTTLFVRGHAGVSLTADGEALLPWIQDVYTSEVSLRTRLNEIRNLEEGSVRIAAIASVSIHWLPGIFDTFLKEHPKIKLEVFCFENQDEMEERMHAGDFDCGFMIDPSQLGFYTIPLFLDPLYIVVPKNHPYASRKVFPTKALAEEPYIKVRNDSRTEIDKLFERHGVEPKIRFEMDNDFAVMGMVNKGMGYGVFSKLILRNSPFDLAMLEPEHSLPRYIAIAPRSKNRSSFATREFIDSVYEWSKAHAEEF